MEWRDSMYRHSQPGLLPSRHGSFALAFAGGILLATLVAGFPVGVEAQADGPEPVRVTLSGVVYDALTGTAVPGAAVYLEGEVYGVLADSAGVFQFEDAAPGPQLIAAIQFGYEETAEIVNVPEGPDAFIEVELIPQPIVLDGVTAVVDNISTMERRFRSRRRAVAFQTRAFDQERMLRSASSTVLEFLEGETRYYPVVCPAGAQFMSTRCIIRRGRVISPRVFIDEIRAFGGLDELASYPTAQIYLLEVYSAGAEIRGYTYNFMQRMAHRPVALIPINLWP